MYVIQNNPVLCDKFQNIGQSTKTLHLRQYIYDSSFEFSYLIFYQLLVIASHCKLHNILTFAFLVGKMLPYQPEAF